MMLATTPPKNTNATGSAPGPRCHTCEKPVRGHRMMNRRRICPRDFDKYDALRGGLGVEAEEEEEEEEGARDEDQEQDQDDASAPSPGTLNLKREQTIRPDVLRGGPPASPTSPSHARASKFSPSFVIPETGVWHRRNPNWVDKKPVLEPAGSGLARTTSLVPTEIVDPNDPGASAVRSARTSGVGVGVGGVAGICVKHEPHTHIEDKLDARGGAEARGAAAVVDARAHAGWRAWRWRIFELVVAGMLGGWVVLNGSWMVSDATACACHCAA